jgi:hypothetical protein
MEGLMRIFLAAPRFNELDFLLALGVKSILITPHHTLKHIWSVLLSGRAPKSHSLEKAYATLSKVPYLVMDSGAHGLLVSHGIRAEAAGLRHSSRENLKKIDPHHWFETYLKFVGLFKDILHAFVELDVGQLVGDNVVARWREKLVAVGGQEKLIVVTHNYMGDIPATVEKWVGDGFTYIGIGDQPSGSVLADVFKVAPPPKIRVHGFAYISIPSLFAFPFYSVDSASWRWMSIYGAVKTLLRGDISNRRWRKRGNILGAANKIFNKIKVSPRYWLRLNRNTLADGDFRRVIGKNVEYYIMLERLLTHYWAKKGVIFPHEAENDIHTV